MGFFDKAREGFSELRAFQAREEQWGRIVSIDSKIGPRIKVQLELHREERELETVSVTSIVPPGVTPLVGQDVAIVDRTGPGASKASWGIKWNDAPQYGTPDPSQEQLQEAVLPSVMASMPAVKAPTLEDVEKMRESGAVSEEDYQTMVRNITAATEKLEQLRASGAITEEAYQQAKGLEAWMAEARESATSGQPLQAPNPASMLGDVARTLDDAGEGELIRNGDSARAVVLELPTGVEDDRFSLRMPLEVIPGGDDPGYRVECAFPAARPVADLEVGTNLPVKVDPEDRKRVAVVWNLWRSEIG